MLAGLTVIIYGLTVMPVIGVEVVPSVYVILHGDVPVKVTVREAVVPGQIALVPVMIAVGKGFTVTVALLVTEFEQLVASVMLVTV